MRIDRVLRKFRKIVASFSQSWKWSNELTKVQLQNNLPAHKLKGDVSTRWGSTAVMVKRILEQKEAVRVVLSADRSTSHLTISWQDIDLLTSLESFLSPLEDLTDSLSGESHVTISAVKPLLNHLYTELLMPATGDTDLTKQMKMRCKAKLQQQYEAKSVKKILDISTFLDPRFKHYSDDHDRKLEIEEQVKIEMIKVIEEEDVEDLQCIGECSPPSPKKSKLGKFLGKKYGLGKLKSNDVSDILSPLEKAKNEISMYLQHPQLHVDSCALAWWKREAIHLPILSRLVRKYLCICATSVASERAFSTGGNIDTSKRNCLKPHSGGGSTTELGGHKQWQELLPAAKPTHTLI